MRFKDDQRPACSPDVLARMLDGEAVLLDLASGTYFGLNAVASRVWELLSAGKNVGEVRAAMLREFEVAPEELERDLEDLLVRLGERGIIRWDDTARV